MSIPHKPHHKQLKRTNGFTKKRKPMRKVGKVTGKWLHEDRPICVKEWRDVDYCTLQYEGCWRSNDGYAHSLKRVNRTRPEHDIEVCPACSFCHLEKLERMGVVKMAEEVRRIRTEYGLPTYE